MIKEKLNLPVGKFPEQDRWLSMDDYVRFINFCHTYFPPKKQSKKDELTMRVNVPFSIK